MKLNLKKICSAYPKPIELVKNAIPQRARIRKATSFSPGKLYQISAIFPGKKSFKVLIKNDRGEPELLDQEKVELFYDG